MNQCNQSAADLLQYLLSLTLADRTSAISNDVLTGKDKFRFIDPHDLAEALGAEQPWKPIAGDWSFTCFARIPTVEEYAEYNSPVSEIVYLIEDKVSSERFKELCNSSSEFDDQDEPQFEFLTKDERILLEKEMALDQLEGNLSNGMNTIALYYVETDQGDRLNFEGLIEDDGSCITLRSPYDIRTEGLTNLEHCVTEKW